MLDVAFAKPGLPKSGALVLLLEEGGTADSPTGATWKAVDAATGGAIARALAAAEFTGKKGQTAKILAPGAGLSCVLALGLGKLADVTTLRFEEAGGALATALAREPSATIASDGLTAEQAASVAMGAALRAYRFDRYRTKEKAEDKPRLASLTVLAADPAGAKSAWSPMRAVADGVFIARDLVSEPPNVLTPMEMADRCRGLERLGLKVEVLGPKEMAKLGMGALLGVSWGSATEPRLVVMRWDGIGKSGGKPKQKPLCFIGKGVTFDTGGISIKPAGGMEDMKWDMAGSGAVVGLMAALAGRRARVDAVGLVGLVENMPDGKAMRPGDVVKSMSGQTIEVINTDAEGRLVLADVLSYCQQKFDPRFMIDLATLTGAIIVGLGHEYGGMFSNDDDLAAKLHAVGNSTGEKLWRMPLHADYDKLIKSEIADMKNIGGRPGGAIIGAQFVQRFVNGKPWAHLDIAGMAWSSKDAPTTPRGATAYGVRLLDRLVAEHYEADAPPMTAIGFYHLTRTGADQALPPLLGRTLAAGQRAVVVCDSGERLAALDAALWLSTNPDWLPHGSQSSGNADLQPIWLATATEAPNGARFLFRIDGAGSEALDNFDRVFDLFDGADDAAVAAARLRWSAATAAGHTLTYWQQTPAGWDKRRG